MSKPTTSIVLNVADFGLPITGPVNLSTCSIDKFISLTTLNKFIILKIPILFPIKAGVSLASTEVFPKNFSP